MMAKILSVNINLSLVIDISKSMYLDRKIMCVIAAIILDYSAK